MTINVSFQALNEIAQWAVVISIIPMVLKSYQFANMLDVGYKKWKSSIDDEKLEKLVNSGDPTVEAALRDHRKDCKMGDDCAIEQLIKK